MTYTPKYLEINMRKQRLQELAGLNEAGNFDVVKTIQRAIDANMALGDHITKLKQNATKKTREYTELVKLESLVNKADSILTTIDYKAFPDSK